MRILILVPILFCLSASCQKITINKPGAPATVTINAPGKGSSVKITTSTPEPPEDDLNNEFNTNESGQQLFVIIGNSIARGTSSGEGPTPSANTVYEWNGTAVVQVSNDDLIAAATGSPWPKMGIDYNAAKGYKPVFSNSAVGGADFSNPGNNTYWATGGTLYPAMKTKTNNALAELGLTRPRGIFVILGINDARGSQDLGDVETAIEDVFDKLEADWPDTRIYVVNLGREASGSSTARINAIRGYLASVVTARENVRFAFDLRIYADEIPAYYAGDNLHLNQTGNDALGAELAAFLTGN